jgi:ComF family protein
MPFESGRDHLCGRCLAAPYAFDLARSALQYRDPAASLISRLKFKGDLTGLSTLAALAGVSAGFRELSTPELIIPVPLHRERLKKRSFNQALLIARELFPDQGTKIEASLLVRNRPTTPQTGLSGRQRRKNLFRAFSVKRPQMTTGKKILLVDDVFTTGSTVHECARTLSRSGAASVEVFTLARAV